MSGHIGWGHAAPVACEALIVRRERLFDGTIRTGNECLLGVQGDLDVGLDANKSRGSRLLCQELSWVNARLRFPSRNPILLCSSLTLGIQEDSQWCGRTTSIFSYMEYHCGLMSRSHQRCVGKRTWCLMWFWVGIWLKSIDVTNSRKNQHVVVVRVFVTFSVTCGIAALLLLFFCF